MILAGGRDSVPLETLWTLYSPIITGFRIGYVNERLESAYDEPVGRLQDGGPEQIRPNDAWLRLGESGL